MKTFTDNKPYLLSLLICLYFSQGLPSGLLAHALPALMREYGVSLTWIGAIKLLALPWFLKFLWAPLIDQHWQRKNWILLFQSLVIPLVLFISFLKPETLFNEWLIPFLTSLFILNTLSASQDIATDGLAIEKLPNHWLGLANSIQVAAYKVGLIIGGTSLLIIIDKLGWQESFSLIALILLFALLPVLFLKKSNSPHPLEEKALPEKNIIKESIISYLKLPNTWIWLLILYTYKMADEMGSSMLKPMLIDYGYSLADIGYLTTAASIVGLIGAFCGGILFLKLSALRILLGFGLFQTLTIGSFFLIPENIENSLLVYFVVLLEQFSDGLSTVALFAVMMNHCREGFEGSDYTLQHCFHIAGAGAASLSSGFIAQALGYQTLFILGMIVGLGSLVLIYSTRDRMTIALHKK